MSLASQVSDFATRVAVEVKAKVNKTRLITAGTGLSGGGDLTVDRTLSVLYGTTAGTATPGDTSRFPVLSGGVVIDGNLRDSLRSGAPLQDADLATPSGWWHVDGSTTPDAGVLFVSAKDDNNLAQILISSVDGALYIRLRRAGAWGSWVAFSSAIVNAATYQPLDSDLTALAGVATQTYGRALLSALRRGPDRDRCLDYHRLWTGVPRARGPGGACCPHP